MSKPIIKFVCSWPKDRTQAWSGTLYYLFEALNKDDRVIINDINISPENMWEKFICKLRRKGTIRLYWLLFNKHYNKKIKKKTKGNIVFSIEEINLGDDYRHYYYQDMCFRLHQFMNKEKPYGWEYAGIKLSFKEFNYITKKIDDNYKKCSAIFSMSHYLYEFFKDNFDKSISKKVYYVGSGVNSVIPNEKNATQKENSFLFIGKDFLRKSGDMVCSAFKKFKEETLSDAKLYIIGPTEIDDKFLSKDIVFLGRQDYNSCANYLRKCKVFVMPSRFEAYGLVFPEALINGCFCIGTNAYEMKYFINDQNGCLVDFTYDDTLNTERLAKAMKLAIESTINIDGQMYAKIYSWANVSNAIINKIILDYTC